MRFLRLLWKSFWLERGLLLRYQLLLGLPQLACTAALFPIYWFTGAYIAHTLGLGDAPVRGHPMQFWFLGLLMSVTIVWLGIGCALGYGVVAVGLRLFGWSWQRVALLLLESQPPSHWLRK